MSKRRSTPPKARIAATVDNEVDEWIKQEAERRDRTKSYVIEELVNQAIGLREGHSVAPSDT